MTVARYRADGGYPKQRMLRRGLPMAGPPYHGS